MFKVRCVDNRYQTILFCDICQEPITEGKKAVLVAQQYSSPVAVLLKPLFVHRGSCLRQAEKAFGGRDQVFKHALEDELRFLIHNLDLDLLKMQAQNDLEARQESASRPA